MPQNNNMPSTAAAGVRQTYTKHPLCAATPMTAQQYQDLKDSIETIGPMTPVVIADGQVLDGWDVYRACIELDMQFQVQELPAHVSAQDYLDAQSITRKATSVEQVSAPTAVVLALESIRIDGNTQSRVELDQTAVAEYAEAMAEGAQFPPLVVFFDGASNWLADGFHRYFGARKAGLVQLAADVRHGTQQDAQLFSFGVNSAHGLRRTNADKRKAVTGALQHPVSCQWSDRQIAKHCGVHHELVGKVRMELSGGNRQIGQERIVTRNGTTYTQNTSNIGKPAPAPTTAPAPAPVAPRTVSVVPPPPSSAPPDPWDTVEKGSFTLPEGMTEEDFGPSEEEKAEAEAEYQLVIKLMEADDPTKAVFEEAKRLKADVERLVRHRDEYMNKAAALEKILRKRENENRRLLKQLDDLKKGGTQ